MITQHIFMFLIVVLVSTNAIIQQGDAEPLFGMNKNNQCEKVRCQHATGMADRLSKLALLPDFVTQTLTLLENLMKEMERELHRSANLLLDQVEPSCKSTMAVIQEILKKKKKRSGREHAELGMGIEPHNSGVHQEHSEVLQVQDTGSEEDSYYNEKEQNIHFNDFGRPSSRDEDSKWQQTSDTTDQQWSSNGYESQRPANGHKMQRPDGYEKHNKWSSVTNKEKKHWRNPVDEKLTQVVDKWRQQSNVRGMHDRHFGNRDQEEDVWVGVSQFDQISNTKQNHGHSKKHGRQDKAIVGIDTNKGIPPIIAPVMKPICRGIDKSSPFWVPGLNQWCRQNCAAGYCPETHCIC